MKSFYVDKKNIDVIKDSKSSENIILLTLNDIINPKAFNYETFDEIIIDCILEHPLRFNPLQKSIVKVKKEQLLENIINITWNVVIADLIPEEISNKMKIHVTLRFSD